MRYLTIRIILVCFNKHVQFHTHTHRRTHTHIHIPFVEAYIIINTNKKTVKDYFLRYYKLTYYILQQAMVLQLLEILDFSPWGWYQHSGIIIE